MHSLAVGTAPAGKLAEQQGNRDYGDTSAHGRTGRVREFPYSLNGQILSIFWKVVGLAGDVFIFGNAPRNYMPYGFSMYVFPLMYLPVIARLTDARMEEHSE